MIGDSWVFLKIPLLQPDWFCILKNTDHCFCKPLLGTTIFFHFLIYYFWIILATFLGNIWNGFTHFWAFYMSFVREMNICLLVIFFELFVLLKTYGIIPFGMKTSRSKILSFLLFCCCSSSKQACCTLTVSCCLAASVRFLPPSIQASQTSSV